MTGRELPLEAPNIQCARCHGALADHEPQIGVGLLYHEGRSCAINVTELREQVYAWADYALGNPDRARERNYRLRTGAPV
jgi:hypothetical protein